MSNETLPKSAQNAPYPIEVEEGKMYSWCACGLSSKQPFCDGSHKGTGLKSIPYKATHTKTIYFCGCKKSGTQPLCDGSHLNL